MTRTKEIAALAAHMGLSPLEAIALPTVIEVACRKSGLSTRELICDLWTNGDLADYLAKACRKGAQAL